MGNELLFPRGRRGPFDDEGEFAFNFVGSPGAGLIVPPEGWYELGSVENPDLTIGAHAEGLHAYDYDVALGPSGTGTGASVDKNAHGIVMDSGKALYAGMIVHACSCSLELDPVVSIVFQRNNATTGTRFGVAAEDVSDNEVQNNENLRIGATFNSAAILHCARSEARIAQAFPVMVDGDWYRFEFEPSDYGYARLYHLASSGLADRDGGTLVWDTVFSFNANLPGSVVAPWIGPADTLVANYQRVRAVRITTRRTIQ